MSEIEKEIGPNRLLKQLVKKHEKEYLEVAFKRTGLCHGIIDAVGLAAWQEVGGAQLISRFFVLTFGQNPLALSFVIPKSRLWQTKKRPRECVTHTLF